MRAEPLTSRPATPSAWPPPPSIPDMAPRPKLPPQPAHAAAELVELDYTVVQALHRKASDHLAKVLKELGEVTPMRRSAEEMRIVSALVTEWGNTQLTVGAAHHQAIEQAMVDAVAAELLGTGRLQALLEDDSISNITIKGFDQVRIEYRGGRVELGKPVANDDDNLISIVQNLARRASQAGSTERSLTATKPMLDMQLPGGGRLTAMIDVVDRPTVVIRKHGNLAITLDDLVGPFYKMIDPVLRDFLEAAIHAGLNIVWAGYPGSGKTTLMRAAASALDPWEWFITLEQSRELGLHTTGEHPWVVSLEARQGHGERGPDGRPVGEISVDDLFPWTLRLNAKRVWIGEVRDGEMLAALQAFGTTHGSMCTIHARGFQSVFDRMVDLAMQKTGEASPERVLRQVAGVVDLVVYVDYLNQSRIDGGEHRYVSHVIEVNGIADGGKGVRTTTVFGPGTDGRAVPLHNPERFMPSLQDAGWNPHQFHSTKGVGAWPYPLDLVIRR